MADREVGERGDGAICSPHRPSVVCVRSTIARDVIPAWLDASLAKSVAKQPTERTEALSALVEDLRRPNPLLGYDRLRPRIERDLVGFWGALAIGALARNVVLLFLLS